MVTPFLFALIFLFLVQLYDACVIKKKIYCFLYFLPNLEWISHLLDDFSWVDLCYFLLFLKIVRLSNGKNIIIVSFFIIRFSIKRLLENLLLDLLDCFIEFIFSNIEWYILKFYSFPVLNIFYSMWCCGKNWLIIFMRLDRWPLCENKC